MQPSGLEERFAESMRALTDLYSEAIRMRRSATGAERAFGEGLRVGDAVRRAVKQGRAERPDEADCSALDVIVDRLRTAVDEALAGQEAAELRRCLERDDLVSAARCACLVYAGLEPATAVGPFAYRPIALRSRRPDAGETLLLPEDLARRIAGHVATGLAPDRASDRGSARATHLPDPVVLAPSLDGSGSEVAIRVALDTLGAPPLHHADTGDVWVFAARLGGPFSVVAAAEAEDEWWAASPVPYRDYLIRLGAALQVHELPLFIGGEALP